MLGPGSISHGVELAAAVVQFSLLVVASWADLSTRLIPNGACLGIGLAGAIFRLSLGPLALLESLAVAVALFLLLLLAHAKGMFGGGDVKLFVAVALGLSFTETMRLIFVTALAGGVLALTHFALRYLPRPRLARAGASALHRVYAAERWRILRHAPLPYGLAIACGGVWAILAHQGI